MFPSWARDVIEVVEPATVDDYGRTVPDYDAPPVSVTPYTGVVQPLSAEERAIAGRTATAGQLEALIPAVVDLPAFARVRVPSRPGRLFEVVGEPRVFQSPTGALDHTALSLKRWEG